jgi:hypothetical protein
VSEVEQVALELLARHDRPVRQGEYVVVRHRGFESVRCAPDDDISLAIP